ncbi:MAG TPA: HAD-IC family P-type ATPase, partial [Polyangia bacterium]
MMPSLPLYALRKSEVYEALETAPGGLTTQQAEERRALYGRNLLSEPPAPPAWRKWLRYAVHPMALLLWAAGTLAVAIGRGELGFTIWIVVLINASFSFWREYRAGQAVAALKDLLPAYARVLRAGLELRLSAADLVPGDVLLLAQGDSVPADARLVEAFGLRTNNSTLTGESLPSLKTADASLRESLSEIERPNLVFAGTSVISGTGRAVVFATGMATQFGRIASLTQALKEGPSLIQAQMVRITRLLSLVALVTGAIVFVVGINDVGISPSEAFILAIGIVVAVIPEGLVPTVTLTLAMAVQRLARQGVLVKKLAAVETLGATSVICTDKSGTLTQNQMTVRRLWVAGKQFSVGGAGYEPQGEIRPLDGEVNPIDLGALCKAALLCNNARLVPPEASGRSSQALNLPSFVENRWTSLGDQTEAALKVLALKCGLDEPALAKAYPRLHELPFEARRKRMSTIHHNSRSDVAFVKGAPREVLQLCNHILVDGAAVPLDEATRA